MKLRKLFMYADLSYIIQPYLNKFVVIFIDDILVYSKSK